MHGKGLHLRAKQAMVPFHGHYSILQMNVPLITRPTSECHPLYFSSKKANNRTSSQPRIHYIFHINSHGYKIHSFTSFRKIYNQYYCIAKGITRASHCINLGGFDCPTQKWPKMDLNITLRHSRMRRTIVSS